MFNWFVLPFLLFGLGVADEAPTFTYEVWVIAFDEIPSSQILPYIMQLQEEAKIDILTKTTEKCSLRVFPGYEAEVMEYFSGLGLEVKIQEINLEEHINETRKKRQSSQCTSSICDILPADEYLTYGQIEAYLSSISENNPDRVTKTSIGTTFEGQNIWMITIKNGSAPTERSMFIEGGIHAREWISPAVTLYFIDMLIKEPEIANGIEFRFVAVANPDGYVYTHNVDRLWRKNRRINSGSSCRGVDLNRNWGYHYGVSGTSSNPCSQVYKGTSAFSEMETQSLSNAMSDAENLKLFLAIHSYGQYMVYPWSYGYDFPPVNQKFVATRYTFAVEAVNNYHYTPINAADWYPAAGTTDDWALGVLGVNIALTLEVRDEGQYGFVLPASQIAPTRAENWEGFKYLISHAKSV